MVTRIISILSLAALLAVPMKTEPWGGKVITVASGTAVRLSVGRSLLASSIFFQMDVGATGVGYVLSAPIGTTCAYQGAGTTLIAKLNPGSTPTVVGGNATIPSNSDPAGGSDVTLYCVDGSHTGDGIITSWNLR